MRRQLIALPVHDTGRTLRVRASLRRGLGCYNLEYEAYTHENACIYYLQKEGIILSK